MFEASQAEELEPKRRDTHLSPVLVLLFFTMPQIDDIITMGKDLQDHLQSLDVQSSSTNT